MKRFFRFAVKHRTLSKVIAFALGFVVLYVAYYIENNVLKFVAYGFLGGSYAFLETCFVYLLKEPTKAFGDQSFCMIREFRRPSGLSLYVTARRRSDIWESSVGRTI